MAHISSLPSVHLPPASAEYETALRGAPGKAPQIQKWKMFRSSQGATHLDFGKAGMISQPGAKQTVLLDHVKREAHIVPAPPQGPKPAVPGMPAAAGAAPGLQPPAQLLHVKDLGKQTIGGHPAEGRMFTFAPPKVPGAGLPKPGAAPKLPAMPKMLGVQAPGLKPPASAAAPQAAPPPASAASPPKGQVQTLEVWTHSTLKVPVLTKTSGIPGLQSHTCKSAQGGEPPASLFQIPPGYKLVPPKPPRPG
ncbi:MAG TPA: hypothetical protein VMT86_16600 [Bryobacteraceae bacterium]|nr:hypothetical protein [Bryobacteraceae bacterium]